MKTVHNESQETKDFLTDFIAPDFFFSRKDVWHRFGMLGVFGDFVLSCTQGNILEIGAGESSIYLSHLARKYHRSILHCDISPAKILNPLTVAGYLTIDGHPGINEAARPPETFEYQNSQFFLGPSDDLFKKDPWDIYPLALSFIDGDHIYEQVKKDFDNVVARTVENGYIFLHDTYPPSEDYLREEACGTVYKLRQEIEADPRFDCITLPKGCAVSVGLTIVRVKPAKRAHYNE